MWVTMWDKNLGKKKALVNTKAFFNIWRMRCSITYIRGAGMLSDMSLTTLMWQK